MKRCEYVEGPEALQNFKRFATAILQANRRKKKKKRTPKEPSVRKTKNFDKD